ncbi:hypothetical protein AGOR_G00001190 [Albula goreensis]|uniref:Leucine-rich repeat-containing protein 56 n=1 Tax=Albula goreensis TaxID=1534307 RepID=A0A8T3E3N8_9TELE|nr:hypothetical protein AGOR_G00001190 [Albula goreensis]
MHSSVDESRTATRPSTPRVSVTELSGSGQTNPTPAIDEDSEIQVELYLSVEKLRDLTGVEDLQQVTTLEMCVDTRENTLGNFGSYLPNLLHLKMNNSLIMSVRDLGTTLPHLQVLWMGRCGLADLDGILSFSSLKELYVAYNDISDLSQVSMLEQLEVLDLEGNAVDDLIQVQYLGLCGQLSHLTLEGNPVCIRPNPGAAQTAQYEYRSTVRELVPQLRFLDNVPVGDAGLHCDRATVEDWALLKECIKDSASAGDDSSASICSSPRPGSAQRPVTAGPAHFPLSSPASRPGSARTVSSPVSRPGSAESDPASLDPDASGLTHGVGRVICGNPVQALRARRKKMGIPALLPHPITPTALMHIPEHTFDLEVSDGKDRNDVFSELRAWRKEHSKRLRAIEKERQPQVLKISHSEEEDEGEEEEGMGYSLSSTSDDEDEEEGGRAGCGYLVNAASPDSSFNSPPPDLLYEREAASPEISRLSLSPDPSLSPSPPPALSAPPGGLGRLSGVRTRRLRATGPGMEPLHPGEEACAAGPGAGRGGSALEETEEVKPKTQGTLGPHTLAPLRPVSSPALHAPRPPSTEVSGSCKQPVRGHQPVIRSSAMRSQERAGPPLLTRPLTARAVLQRLPNRMELLPKLGTSHCHANSSH